MPGARHDVFRASQSHHSSHHLRQGSRFRRENHSRHQGTGSFLRRHSADDRERHLHHQRYRARHRQPVAPFAGRVLRERQQPLLLPRQDYSVPRIVGGIRIRHKEHSLRAHRSQAQIPRLDLPARAGHEVQRRHPAHLLSGGADFPARQGSVLEHFAGHRRSQADARDPQSKDPKK